MEYYFLAEDKARFNMLRSRNLPVIYYPGLRAIWILLRTHILIVDDTDWRQRGKHPLLIKAKKIQLWHGIGLKKVGLSDAYIKEFDESLPGRLHNALKGNHIKYDAVVSSSAFFTQNKFSKAFKANAFIETGYPRNDLFFTEDNNELYCIGADETALLEIHRLREKGYRIILYAPTFRNSGTNAISEGILNIDRLSDFAELQKAVFVFKFHAVSGINETFQKSGIIPYSAPADIQPLLKMTDILITDYSSVYIDFLLLDKPVVFLNYDQEEYARQDRGFILDYDTMTPGPKCRCQQELLTVLGDLLSEKRDDYAEKRLDILKLAFECTNGNASERIWKFITEQV